MDFSYIAAINYERIRAGCYVHVEDAEPTRELDCLAVDDEVRELLCDLPTFFLVLRQVELLPQLHVKHLHNRSKEAGRTSTLVYRRAKESAESQRGTSTSLPFLYSLLS